MILWLSLFRLPWDAWSSPSFSVCKTLAQFLAHEKEYYRLVDIVATDLVNQTGCLRPCSYYEYKLAAKPKKVSSLEYSLMLRFDKTEVVEEKEDYIYGFVSFVSEFGGSLGLFLGFSFLTVWEILEPFFTLFYKTSTASGKTRSMWTRTLSSLASSLYSHLGTFV